MPEKKDLKDMTNDELRAEERACVNALDAALAAEGAGATPDLPGSIQQQTHAAANRLAKASEDAEHALKEVRAEMTRRSA